MQAPQTNGNSAAASEMEVIFLGSGSSAPIPAVKCLTDPTGCRACPSSVVPGSFDYRRNTSVAIRLRDTQTGEPRTIMIDCGKDVYSAIANAFPQHGLRNIDTLLVSHEHLDACGGFDDLRDWSQAKSVRAGRLMLQGGLTVYADPEAFDRINVINEHCFGAKGAHDNRVINEHPITNTKPFQLFGHTITPLKVQHGSTFYGTPYYSLGYMFDDKIAYIGDYSKIPPETAEVLARAQPTVMILDATANLEPARGGHAGLPDAVALAQSMPHNRRVYLTGIEHDHSHVDWIAACKAVDGSTPPPSPVPQGVASAVDETFVTDAVNACAKVRDTTQDIWVRPGRDGLRIVVQADGRVKDSDYD